MMTSNTTLEVENEGDDGMAVEWDADSVDDSTRDKISCQKSSLESSHWV